MYKRLAVAFTGPSNSGKTTLIQKVATKLIAQDYKVVIIKNDPKDKAKFIKELYKDLSQQELENKNWEFSLAGRLMAKREMGKLIFAHIQDQTDKIQILIAKNEIAEDKFKFFKKASISFSPII